MDQALKSQKTPHTSPLRASYGMSFVSILMKNDRVIKGFYCIWMNIVSRCVYKWYTFGHLVAYSYIATAMIIHASPYESEQQAER